MTPRLEDYLPDALRRLENPQTDIPRIAKDPRLTAPIAGAFRFALERMGAEARAAAPRVAPQAASARPSMACLDHPCGSPHKTGDPAGKETT